MKKADSQLNLERICRLLNIPVSSYYERQSRITKKSKKIHIINKIKEIHDDNLHCYGRRRIFKELRNKGVDIGMFKVRRLMKEAGVVAKKPKKPHYYSSGNEKPNIPNLLNRQFNPGSMNTHWVGDITYIRNQQGWSYLATVLD